MTWNFSRRKFLGLVGASSLSAFTGTLPATADQPLYLSSSQSGKNHNAVIFAADGKLVASIDLQGRAHGGAFSPINQHAVIFARRPGRFALVINKTTGHILSSLTPPDNRHFYGHGYFSGDGKLLFASENDFENARGVISVWDVENNFNRVAEFDSQGIGPHEIVMLSDGKTLLVANGGIETHPDTGRTKLNLFDMQPNLTWLDTRTGAKVRQVVLPRELHKLSIRHLAATRDGLVTVGLQNQGHDGQTPSLAFMVKGKDLHWLNAPRETLAKMVNYCGSVGLDASGEIAAISHPRGSMITFWSVKENRFLKSITLADGCGVAAMPQAGSFILSGGEGNLIQYNALTGHQRVITSGQKLQWDNHISTG